MDFHEIEFSQTDTFLKALNMYTKYLLEIKSIFL